jgi:acyl-CoA synthetase (AMP-forming)/AMP-acid ligase II
MNLLPGVGFVNAYGLTETASTIAVLTPEDHAEAFSSDDPLVRARLGSVGRPLPTLEVEIRGPADEVLPPGDHGEIWVRGDQVAGEYVGRAASLTPEGWFPTSDGGWLDGDGFLFVDGRLDDVIVRGGENLSPGEIEDVLVRHEAVAEAAVVGVPNEEWGEVAVAAVVVASGTHPTDGELKDWVRARLRGSRVPEQVVFVGHLPHNETGKLLRRVLKQELIIALELEHHTPVEPGV